MDRWHVIDSIKHKGFKIGIVAFVELKVESAEDEILREAIYQIAKDKPISPIVEYEDNKIKEIIIFDIKDFINYDLEKELEETMKKIAEKIEKRYKELKKIVKNCIIAQEIINRATMRGKFTKLCEELDIPIL